MKLDGCLVWRDANAMVTANREVLAVLSGVFFLLPSLAFSLFMPQPEPPAGADVKQLMAMMREFYMAAAPWFLVMTLVQTVGQVAVLAKARSTEPRRFGNPASAMILLREVGIAVAQLDATDWNPDEKDMSRSRSSQAEAMRTAHQAAAHNRWLAAEIQESLDDPRPSVPHDEAMAAMDAEIDAIELQRAGSARRRGA